MGTTKATLTLRTPLLRSLDLSAMKAVCEESRQSSLLEHPVKPGDVKHYLCVLSAEFFQPRLQDLMWRPPLASAQL